MARKLFKKLSDDATKLLIDHEYRLLVLETVLDWIISENQRSGINLPTIEVIDSIKQESIKKLQTEYPGFGIRLKDDTSGDDHEG